MNKAREEIAPDCPHQPHTHEDQLYILSCQKIGTLASLNHRQQTDKNISEVKECFLIF